MCVQTKTITLNCCPVNQKRIMEAKRKGLVYRYYLLSADNRNMDARGCRSYDEFTPPVHRVLLNFFLTKTFSKTFVPFTRFPLLSLKPSMLTLVRHLVFIQNTWLMSAVKPLSAVLFLSLPLLQMLHSSLCLCFNTIMTIHVVKIGDGQLRFRISFDHKLDWRNIQLEQEYSESSF